MLSRYDRSSVSVKLRFSKWWTAMELLPFVILAMANAASAQSIPETSGFAVNGNKISASATTIFMEPLWTSEDATNTAHHELLHAIGFTVTYDKFKEHVDAAAV